MDALVEYALMLRDILARRRQEREFAMGYISYPEPLFDLLTERTYGQPSEPCTYRPALTPLHKP